MRVVAGTARAYTQKANKKHGVYGARVCDAGLVIIPTTPELNTEQLNKVRAR